MKKACPEIYGHNINWNFSSLNIILTKHERRVHQRCKDFIPANMPFLKIHQDFC